MMKVRGLGNSTESLTNLYITVCVIWGKKINLTGLECGKNHHPTELLGTQ